MQLSKKSISQAHRHRLGVQISARRFLRHCSKLLNGSKSALIEEIRERARAALRVFPKLQKPVRVDCPYVQLVVQVTQEILESIKEGIRREMETGLLNYLTWTSLLSAAKTTAHQISSNLADTHHGLTRKVTQFLSALIGEVDHRIQHIENASKALLHSIDMITPTFAMTYRTSQNYLVNETKFSSKGAQSRYKINLPQPAENTYLKRTS